MWRAVVVAAVVLTGCGVDSTAPRPSVTTSTKLPDLRYGAFDACKTFVSRQLKAPTTATWRDPFGDQVIYEGSGDGPYTVRASVDSENSFGAKIRTAYTCVVTLASKDEWRLIDLKMT